MSDAAGGVTFRPATRADLPALVAMLADDALGARRERAEAPLPEAYADAFAAIESNPWIELIVAEVEGGSGGASGGEPVACLQLTFVPGLSRQGATRAQIEAVRVRADRRGQGLGHALVGHAIERARARGAALVEATSDKSRADAHRFWRDLGFENSHEGFKLALG